MADREIVIRIPEDKYDRLIQQMRLDRNFREYEITELGEHGKLGDLDALGKIRAEIEQIEINGHIRDVECFSAGINAALTIIDKYRVEGSDKE